MNTSKIEFWFDAACPWCWMTSRWMAEVAQVRNFEIEWHPFSLAILNEDKDAGAHQEAQQRSLRAMRVVEAARAAHGAGVVGQLYTEIGERAHPGGRSDTDVIVAEALAALGLPAELIAAADETVSDEALRANVATAMDLAGPNVGIPIIAIDGVAFFGPVVTPAPTGETALKLWDAVVAASQVPGFYELKRGRKVGPQF